MVDDEASAAATGVIADGGRFDFHLLRQPPYQVFLEPVQLLRGQPSPVLPVQYVQVDRDLPYGLDGARAALLTRGRGRHPRGRQVLLLGGHQAGQPDRAAATVFVRGVCCVHVAFNAEEYQSAGERVRHQQRAHERVPQTTLVALAFGVRHAGPFHAVVVAVAAEAPLAVVHHRHAADHRGRRQPVAAAVVRRRVTAARRRPAAVVVRGRSGHRLRATRRRPIHDDAPAGAASLDPAVSRRVLRRRRRRQ